MWKQRYWWFISWLFLSWTIESVYSFASCFEKICSWRTLCKPIFWKLSHMFHAVINWWGELKQNKTKKNPCFPPIFLWFYKITWTSVSFSVKWEHIDSRGKVNTYGSAQNSFKFDVFAFGVQFAIYISWGKTDLKVHGSLKREEIVLSVKVGIYRWGGRWEGGTGWGTLVNPWLIHVNVPVHCINTISTINTINTM